MAELEKMKRTEMSAAEPQNAVGNPNQAAQPQNAIGSPSVSDKSPNLMQQHQQQKAQRLEKAFTQEAQRMNAAANPNQAANPQNAQQELAAKQQILSSMQTTPAAGQAQAAVSIQHQASAPQQRELTPPIMGFAPDTPSPNLKAQAQQTTTPATAPATATTAPRATSQELYGPRTTINATVTPRMNYVDTTEMERNLKAINDAAAKQATRQIDEATRTSADQARLAEAEAQAQYNEQKNQIALDEKMALDNAALYAEARGDRGGVGQAQYNAVQAAATRNRANVQAAQTKMASDVTRQIGDLRRQGEYQKADALLSLSQQYLSQVNQLKQWAAEMNMSVDQVNLSIAQWEKEFEQAEAQITGQYKGQQTFAAQQAGIQNAMSEAGLTGQYKGQQTFAAQQAGIQNAMSEAGLTGQYNGQKTLEAQQMDADNAYRDKTLAIDQAQLDLDKAVSEANLTGNYNGQKTLEAQQMDADNAYRKATFELDKAISEANLTGDYNGQKTLDAQRLAIDEAKADLDKAISEANLTGVYNGQKTLDAQKLEIAKAETALDKAIAEANLTGVYNGQKTMDAQQMEWDENYRRDALALDQAQQKLNEDKFNYEKDIDSATTTTNNTTTNNTSTQKTDDYDGLFSAAAKAQSPENYIASHYKEYGFNSSTGLADAFTTYQKKTTAQQDNPANVSIGVIDPATNRMITRADPRVVNITYDSQGRSVYHLKDGRVLTDTLGGKDPSKIPGKNVATYLK